ncbi:MAG: right-handed parallel beta-helix repeat-containing protein [Kiritimatiellae bacterium]|nr:right-handed parallel beta-helix repeat-containing protein [Kiritimatiellia bacterium]
MMANIFHCGLIAALAVAGLNGYAEQKTVVASKFGWNAEDATECLRAALKSGAKTVRIDKQQSDWVLSSTVRIPSNVEVVLEDGVTLRAMPERFKGLTDSLLAVVREKNVTLRGEGTARLLMNKADYFDKTRYRIGEWRHAVNLMDAERLIISNLTIEASGGDGVYVNGCRLGLIDKVTSVGNARQGVSIISADRLMIRNSRFIQTKGVNPQCGIDIEPHVDTCRVKKVIIDNCQFEGNAAHGIAINVSGMSAKSEPLSVTVRNCTVSGNGGYGIWALLARASHEPVKGKVRFENCHIKSNKLVPLDISNLCAGALAFDFTNCIFDAGDRAVAIRIKNGTVSHDVGDISFEKCKVITGRNSHFPVSFAGSTGVGVVGTKGKLEWMCGTNKKSFDMESLIKNHPPKPELKKFTVAACDLKNLVPISAKGENGEIKTGTSPMIRGPFSFIQRTPSGGEFPITFKGVKFGQPCEISVFDQAGTPHDTFTIKPGPSQYKYILKTRGAHVFRFDVQPRGGMWTVHSETPGHGILATSRVPLFIVRNHDMYFSAPANAEEVVVELSPSGGEYVTAELISPDGTVSDRCEKSPVGVLLRGKCKKSKKQIWRLRGIFFLEDASVRLGGDAVPVIAFDPNSVLTTLPSAQ